MAADDAPTMKGRGWVVALAIMLIVLPQFGALAALLFLGLAALFSTDSPSPVGSEFWIPWGLGVGVIVLAMIIFVVCGIILLVIALRS